MTQSGHCLAYRDARSIPRPPRRARFFRRSWASVFVGGERWAQAERLGAVRTVRAVGQDRL
jgi:hypothetical protein